MILHPQEVIDRRRLSGAWGDRTIDSVFRATVAARGDEMAVVDAPNRMQIDGQAPRRLTYAQHDALTDVIAARLLQLGVRKDDIVFAQAPNVAEFIAFIQACARIGAVLSPAPMQYGGHEISQILDTLGRTALAVTIAQFKGQERVSYLRQAVARAKDPPPVAVIGPSESDAVRLDAPTDDVVAARALVSTYCAKNPVGADEVFTICWTSGTTAEPKGVPRTHNNWIWHGAAVVEAGNYRDRECLLSPFPAVNMGGFGSALLPWWLTGGKLVLHHPFDLELYARQIAEEKVGLTLAAPAVLTALLQNEELLARYDISCLHDVPSGAAALSPWLITEFKRRFGIEVINQFGSNEGLTLASSSFEVPDPEQRAALFPRIGAPGLTWRLNFTREVESKIVDENDEEITEPGRLGELLMRSPSMFPGYWNRPELTKAAFTADGFYRSGDMFEIVADAAGAPRFYRFAGRAKELIIRGGFNIAPPEIEALLLTHPAIAESAVVGWPDERLGERVCACIVTRPGMAAPTLDDILALFARADVAKFKWPERLEVLAELPRNPLGKVVKRELLARLRAAAAEPADA